MEKVLGIVAEYNPFHNGHLYHLQESKKITDSNYTIAVISGNFTQRGNTSIVDKWEKANMAIKNGVDLVIELPLVYSISSAENFADGAIKILNSLNIVDYISFGAETNNISLLDKIATILYEEPKKYKELLSKNLDLGLSFPKAREIALISYLDNNNEKEILDALSKPNNILGIEYLKALKKYKSSISPICVKRFKAGYNDLDVQDNIASASSIRNIILENNFEELKKLMPNVSYDILIKNIENKNYVKDINIFEKQIIYNLRKMSLEEISNLPDVSEGLEHLIKTAAISSNNLNDLINSIKSKRYTLSRINRILLYSLLNISKDDINLSKEITPYIRILAFNDNGKKLLSAISKANPNINLVTSVSKFMDNCTDNKLKYLLEKDIFATNVYSLYLNNMKGNMDYIKRLNMN